jgi:hypothetical protein
LSNHCLYIHATLSENVAEEWNKYIPIKVMLTIIVEENASPLQYYLRAVYLDKALQTRAKYPRVVFEYSIRLSLKETKDQIKKEDND